MDSPPVLLEVGTELAEAARAEVHTDPHATLLVLLQGLTPSLADRARQPAFTVTREATGGR